MQKNRRKMRTINIKSLFICVCILSLTVADIKHHGIPEQQIVSLKTVQTEKYATKNITQTDINKKTYRISNIKNDGNKLSNKENSDFLRQKRSALSENWNQEDSNIADKVKRLFSDYGYGSRLQAGENVASSYERGGLFGVAGPGKRSEAIEKDKRIKTDYGFGSRLQAAENVAMDWDRNGLFGLLGPGKRSDFDNIQNLEATKRISTDFGYGSRTSAAENAAVSSSHGGLYGLYGPGKRGHELMPFNEMPEFGILKRLTPDYGYGSRTQAAGNVAKSVSKVGLFGVDGPGKRSILKTQGLNSGLHDLEYLRKRFSSDFGYGSREQVAENLAKSLAKGKVFGVFGPGKRSLETTKYRISELLDPERFRKRFSSDFGYGSREQAAENLAKSSAKGKVFGIYGPGKRSGQERDIRSKEVIEADSGYGSRIYAGSQIAKDVVAIDNLFGLLGPGRRK